MAMAMSFGCPNYSGLLYTKSNKATPFLNSICGAKYSRSVKFPVNQTYSLGDPSQPAITETASATAPTATTVTRSQAYNVCQIYQEAVAVTYAKQSNMGTMSGINVANQEPNPQDELDFQIARRMEHIANDVEYTSLQGAYQEAANDTTANKSRGIITAVTTNLLTNSGTARALTKTLLKALFKSIFDNGGIVDGSILLLNSFLKGKLTDLYEGQTGFVTPLSRNVGGVNINELVTDFGNVGIMLSRNVPAGKILCYNPSVCSPVEMIVPGKGNFFYEPLSKTGAAESGQIFGQLGLDYGPEWFHGVLGDLSVS